jgi:diguanylate cyclase
VQSDINVKDVAREALRALVLRKLEPTPDNYRRLFNEIAGVAGTEQAPSEVEDMLTRFAAEFPRETPELLRVAKGLERAAAKKDWGTYRTGLLEAAASLASFRSTAEVWSGTLLHLVQQLDLGHRGLTRARKKERLERLLEVPARDPEQLMQKLATLLKNWKETPVDTSSAVELAETSTQRVRLGNVHDEETGTQRLRLGAVHDEETGTSRLRLGAVPVDVPAVQRDTAASTTEDHTREVANALPLALARDDTAAVCDLIAQVLEMGMSVLLGHDPELANQADFLAKQARGARDAKAIAALRTDVRSFLLQVELIGANNTDVQHGLLRLLRLVIENAAELTADDQWLNGQITALHDIVSRPLDLVMIEHAERSLREAIQGQGALRDRLTEAKTALKSMVSGFVERLGEFSQSTGEYHEKLGVISEKVQKADNISELSSVLEEITRETRNVQQATLRSREETLETRRQVDAAERRIRELQAELARVSEKVREDQLTGALNRRGLEQEYDRAVVASEGRGQPMSVALLDIDNFKSLNDTYGHNAGDTALVHLARVIKDTVRPSDVVCRYGGEEFVIMLAGASQDDAVQIMSRVQRELTKRFFLHDNKRLLITFSAGVALRQPGESRDDLIARADAAMYTAKRTGKNRVVSAPHPGQSPDKAA